MLVPPSTWLAGYIPDLPTPFNAAGLVDLEALASLCECQVAAGVPALVVCETAGEASTLSAAEQGLIIRTAVDVVRGRCRIIAGAIANATSHAIELARRAEAAGADAVLSVVPYYNKPMQEGMLAHFRAIAGSTGLPIILHDIPARTLRPLADDTLARLADNRQFVGLRDGSADISRPMRLSGLLPSSFRLLSGDDATAFGFIAGGGDGAISQIANVAPDLCRTILSSCRQGRMQSARYLQKRLVPLETCLSRESPAALKYALSLLGLMRPDTRLPIVELNESAKEEIAHAFAAITDEELIGTAEG
ncbi:4-hydroxy-tetrahydrodipicolinate synthase [Bradyrhizobium iriomotense]|uniref:4-hydroxy-tetrahydrodipicolinate synthase n=1 Tax=Bradyrhizobium iriomotense TaxID=441950 RepID=A0ABQ6AYY2_9BRAD|nr:4-hydroxy-tetrahydrodipicolinate synthase [Bradyrhizobium iriomotense]GLR85082.1 4-hydroxy-tetrahydrodipicolinate synthase [Bradyrhizobium iriomotense]